MKCFLNTTDEANLSSFINTLRLWFESTSTIHTSGALSLKRLYKDLGPIVNLESLTDYFSFVSFAQKVKLRDLIIRAFH